MYIEDILFQLFGPFRVSNLDHKSIFSMNEHNLLKSFTSQIHRGHALTEKQAKIIENILPKYISILNSHFVTDLTDSITNPKYRLGKRFSSQQRTVKLVTLTNGSKKIAVSFPFDQNLVDKIREIKDTTSSSNEMPTGRSVTWNADNRNWAFNLYEGHLSQLYKILKEHNFEFDKELLDWIEEIEEIEKNIQNYIPMVTFEEGIYKYVNAHKDIPHPVSTQLLEVLFEAKKYGIETWDENIDIAIKHESVNRFTRVILTSQKNISLADLTEVSRESFSFYDFSDVIKYNGKVLMIIPSGDEYSYLKKIYLSLKNMGYDEDQMCVLFRVDKEKGKITNDFIKEHSLNNPISEKIKIFFVSVKMPKPLIKNQIEIGTVFNMGAVNAHHTLRNFVNNHHNVLTYKMSVEKDANM